jgi:hypothetical protein
MAGGNGAKRTQRNIRKRNRLWPGLKKHMLWSWRESDGFITIPRTLPYFMRIIDSLSVNKPLSSTYLALWCRMWDESGLVITSNSTALAHESGFSGPRAVSTWRGRMKLLIDLGFIKCKPLADEPYGYTLLLSPYYAVKKLVDSKKYNDEGWYNALYERHDEIKASDLDDLENIDEADEDADE